MFERRKRFDWKAPVLILVGAVVLSGGIYVGVKTRDVEKVEEKKIEETNASKEAEEEKGIKEIFNLSEDCEVWVQKKNEDGSDIVDESPMMIGTIDKELLNKTEEEITAYLEDKYPERKIESLSKYQIVLSETVKNESVETNDQTKSNKYCLEADEEFIALYKYDENGNRSLVEKTELKVGSLPKTVQEELKKGIVVNSEDEAYSKLEELGS